MRTINTGGTARSTNFIMNLGLENNPNYDGTTESIGNIITIIQETTGFVVRAEEVVVSEYDGNEERTLILSGNHRTIKGGGQHRVVEDETDTLCTIFDQECIAVKSGWFNEKKTLVYNRRFKGDKFEFNDEYFVELS